MWDVSTSSRTAPFGIEKKEKKRETWVNSRALLNHCSALTLCCEATIQRLCLCNTENNRLSLAHARTHAPDRITLTWIQVPHFWVLFYADTKVYFFHLVAELILRICVWLNSVNRLRLHLVPSERNEELSLPCFFFFIFSSAMYFYGSFLFPSPAGIKWRGIVIASILSSVPTPSDGGVESLNLISLRKFQNERVES